MAVKPTRPGNATSGFPQTLELNLVGEPRSFVCFYPCPVCRCSSQIWRKPGQRGQVLWSVCCRQATCPNHSDTGRQQTTRLKALRVWSLYCRLSVA